MSDRRFVPPPVAISLVAALPLYAVFRSTGPDDPASAARFVSLGAAALLAVAVARLLRTLGVAHAWRWAALGGVLPTTLLDTTLLGMRGALYAAPCIAALDAAVARRDTRMQLWFGVALAFDLQALLFAPFVIALLIRRRVRLYRWLVAPAVFAGALVSAWLLGWPLKELLARSDGLPALSVDAPNVWFVVQSILPRQAAMLSGLALASAAGVTACYIARCSATIAYGRGLLPVAALAVLITAGLLPHMQGSSFFVAGVIAFACAAADRRTWHVAGSVQLGSTLAASGHLFDAPALVILGFAAMAFATLSIAGMLLKPAANDNPPMARTA